VGFRVERRLFLDLGFHPVACHEARPSLFAYCTEALGLCRSAAGRRIVAARVYRRFPEVFQRVARGELQRYPFGYHEASSVLCALNPHLAPANASELFEACSGKSYARVEELLAARFCTFCKPRGSISV
jgi:hypothetical protein